MRNAIARVSNIVLLANATDALIQRAPGLPGIGLIHGPSGYGKSTAIAWLRNFVNGVHIRAWPTWTPTAMLSMIIKELGLQRARAWRR
jgi:ABC-type uncharacterized transport system YnjBCD ATPase subunit